MKLECYIEELKEKIDKKHKRRIALANSNKELYEKNAQKVVVKVLRKEVY